MRKFFSLLFLLGLLGNPVRAQFGMNRVQIKQYDWYYIQTKHFDIYFSAEGKTIAEFAAKVAEESVDSIEKNFTYQINNRISLVLYNSHNDFQETNISDSYISQGIGGFTEPFKNRVVLPFDGDYAQFRHVIHHELTHAVMQDMLYGGSIQNRLSKGITLELPLWYHEGMAEYQSSKWETNTDQFISEAIINEWLPDIQNLDGYIAYRGGQSLFHYIAKTYGEEKIGEILNRIKGLGNLDEAIKSSLGLKMEELNDRWKKDLKKAYFPQIAVREDPDEFAKRLTNNKKEGGFYNSSPSLSPQGDKIAFISDRDIYLDLYIMNSFDGKIIKKAVQSGKTANFEELNVLYPAISWAPDNKRIALSAKGNAADVIHIINTENKDEEELPIRMGGIKSVAFSPDGKMLAFNGSSAKQSDIFLYNLETKELLNLTDDLFTDSDPCWAPDGKTIYFSSDRGDYLDGRSVPKDLDLTRNSAGQTDIYSINISDKKVNRITSWAFTHQKSPAVSPDGQEILFVSDRNGIDNLYRLRIQSKDSTKQIESPVPITNSLNGINQISISKDGKKLVFTSLYKYGYNIFLLNEPFDMAPKGKELSKTNYMTELQSQSQTAGRAKKSETVKTDSLEDMIANAPRAKNIPGTADSVKKLTVKTGVKDGSNIEIFTGQYQETPAKKDSSSLSHFVFGDKGDIRPDTALAREKKELFKEKLDKEGKFMLNKYKVSFSPDLVYANAGYSTLYGLLGTTQLAFSDVLGDQRIIGTTSMEVDLKNSDYGIAYYYLPERIDYGIEAFHTARFVYLTRQESSELFRFRNYGATVSASYPISRFFRMDGSISMLNLLAENLDNTDEPSEKITYWVPSLSFVHDNTLQGYTSPIEGNRYNLTVFGNPGIGGRSHSFYSLTADFRNYWRFFYDNSFAFRLSGGYSAGANPQRFFMGGTENWINRTFSTGDIPLNNASDFAFLTPAMPMRGYNYAEKIGTKYALLNLELRSPIIRYLVTGPLPVLFQNILGNAFIDAGTAWDKNSALKLFGLDDKNNNVTKDLLIGTGVGARAYILFFLLKLDVAWQYNLQAFSAPKYYLSLGMDF